MSTSVLFIIENGQQCCTYMQCTCRVLHILWSAYYVRTLSFVCIGMLSGIISSGAIFNKSLSLDQKTLGKFSLGNVISLVSNDVRKLDFVS